MKECVSRYPQYFKAFYRLAHAFITFKKDFKKAREYLLGNNTSGQHKITGLYGDRKPSNLFNVCNNIALFIFIYLYYKNINMNLGHLEASY
jgi:hypothetical protein